ncbi:MAG: hypothetical protein KC503_09840 [Myxococcales bacterium]|nr:hypothetical protein [Myxococcales bacterium]
MSRFFRVAAIALLAVTIVVGASCGDSKPAQQDTGVKDVNAQDVPQTSDITIDQPQGNDVWPDVNADIWPQNEGGYGGGAPFGCLNDTDCFGQKCCPTPWGVRMCAASCGS